MIPSESVNEDTFGHYLKFLVALLAALAYAQTEYSDEEPRPGPLVTNPPKLHFVDLDDGLSGKYKFGFDTGTSELGRVFRQEKKLDDGTVIGRYGYVDANGKQRIVNYSAGKDGFQATGDIGPDKEGPSVGRVVPNNPAPAPTHRPRPAPRQPAPRRPVQQPYRPPQQQYRPPQQQYAPPQERYTGIPQQAPQQQHFPPQNRYTPQYASPQQQYIPRPRPPQPQQQYIPRPPPQQQYIPRQPQPVAPRPTPRPGPTTTTEMPDYGDPVIPTHLLSYGFGSAYDAGNQQS
ncbi:Adult-specific rigid cuticular protein 12.4 [Nymphon striatum]|nr:Adult-specific rigid cuticular protein 12.4 [Nymphon striatum]